MKDLAPHSDDWLYVRAAALARRVYLTGHVGVGRLTHLMGAKARNGVARNHHGRAGSKIIRFCL